MRRALPLLVLVVAPWVMLPTVGSNPLSAGEDDAVFFHPIRVMVGQSLARGDVPMANPHEATGSALMGDPQTAVMYPSTWLFAVLDGQRAYSLSILLAFVIAGLGAYFYLRRLALIRAASLAGALAFSMGGFMVGHRVHLGMIHTAAFFPWVLWCVEGLRGERTRMRATLALAVCFFLAIAAGHWPILVHMALAWGVYFLVRARPFSRSLFCALGAVALAVALAAPQLVASMDLIEQATRNRLGYALAGENSYYPPAVVLQLFPFLAGSRTPNLFAQEWWGPGHLCELLGYVGLLPLVLAAATALTLRRRTGAAFAPLVRTWTWLAVGAFLFMLGYYLPTYRLIHALPILGIVRCPARMVLVLTFSLATLSAVGIHVAATRTSPLADKLRRRVRRGVLTGLPVAMGLTLAVLAVLARVLPDAWDSQMPWPMVGGLRDLRAALRFANPAVWVPIALWGLTAAAVVAWLKSSKRAVWLLVPLLTLDLFVITRYVDVAVGPPYDPTQSRAAAWLTSQGDPPGTRVLSLTDERLRRPAERVLPKVAHALGVATINSYGPFQSPAHAQLFEFRLWGVSRSWETLLRRNHLLSLYAVKYIVATDPIHTDVLRSIRMTAKDPSPTEPELLNSTWSCSNATALDGTIALDEASPLAPASATQRVSLHARTHYRLALDVRGPDGGAAHFLRADFVEDFGGAAFGYDANPYALMAYDDQMGTDWRHFEWDFTTPASLPDTLTFRVASMGERRLEIRNLSLRAATPYAPVGTMTGVADDDAVYREVATLPPLKKGALPVRVFENRLAEAPETRDFVDATPGTIETLKWHPKPWLDDPAKALPFVGFRVPPAPWNAFYFGTVPATLLILCLAGLGAYARRRQGQ